MLAYVQSLGCAPNQADANAIRRTIAETGFGFTDQPTDAAIVVLLTCSFTEQMEQLNRTRLQELVDGMQSGARLFVGGCLPGMTSGQLGLPKMTYLFGPASMSEALFELRTYAGSVATSREHSYNEEATGGRPHLVRIATGCMSQCTFCAIPQAAGRTKSRTIGDVVAEVVRLESQGVQQVLLTAEDASAYGRDTHESFITLLRAVLSGTSKIMVGIDTLNPKWLRDAIDDFVELLQNQRLARVLYIPIESGSNRILRAMARGYSSADVHKILSKLFALTPPPQIITDFIVGFPGETSEDFEESRKVVLEPAYQFQVVEVFGYTERVGAAAARMPGRLPEEIRRQRADQLIEDVLTRAGSKDLSRRGVVVNTNMQFNQQ